jgi:S1-C subfamily serine protease
VPGDLLDLILLVMLAAFAVAGYRQGFIIGALSLVGFIGGVAGGALIAPPISRALSSSTSTQALVAIVVVFLAAVAGMMLASAIGVAARSRITARPATVLDSLGGAAVNVIALLVVAWLIGSFIGNAPFPAIARQVNDSMVLRAVDRVIPSSALTLPIFPPLRGLLSNGLYEQVFSEIGVDISPDLPAPDPAVLQSPALRRDEASIVKIIGYAPDCSPYPVIEGSGFVISPQHVLTNAHVVAGVRAEPNGSKPGPEVIGNGRDYRGHVVWYDPEIDVAVIYVPGLRAKPLRFAGTAHVDAHAIVVGYPEDSRSIVARPATVGDTIRAVGANIYGSGSVSRRIYSVRAEIRPGNSGGPLLSPGGRVYGVVFARSTDYPEVGFALTASTVANDVNAGRYKRSTVSTQGCQGA